MACQIARATSARVRMRWRWPFLVCCCGGGVGVGTDVGGTDVWEDSSVQVGMNVNHL